MYASGALKLVAMTSTNNFLLKKEMSILSVLSLTVIAIALKWKIINFLELSSIKYFYMVNDPQVSQVLHVNYFNFAD